MCVQSRCRGVYPIWTKPMSAPRPRTSGAGAVHVWLAGAAEREGSAKMADYFLLDPHL